MSVCLCFRSIVARYQLDVRSRCNGELLEASFAMRYLSYERIIGDWFFTELLVIKYGNLVIVIHRSLLHCVMTTL
jgi:hypothetical protein